MEKLYLASINNKQGKYQEAEELYKECLQKQKTILGENHPETVKTKCSISECYNDQFKYDEAERIGRELRTTEINIRKESS